MRYLALGLALLLAGCAYHAPLVSVYGRDSTIFTSPSLCDALLHCLNSGQTVCYYDRSVTQTASGDVVTEECKDVSK